MQSTEIKPSDAVDNNENTVTINDSFFYGKKMSFVHRAVGWMYGQLVVVDGGIGVGKSTAVKSLGRYLEKNDANVRVYLERCDRKLLKLFIDNMNKKERNIYAFPFQMDQLHNRLDIYKEASEFIKKGGIAIIDRSFPGDYVFAYLQHLEGNINDDEWAIYMERTLTLKEYEPLMTVYLQCTPEEALRRTKQRDCENESNYTLEYFQKLYSQYDEVMERIDKDALLNLNWNEKLTMITVVGTCGEEHKYLSDNKCQEILHKMSMLYLKKYI